MRRELLKVGLVTAGLLFVCLLFPAVCLKETVPPVVSAPSCESAVFYDYIAIQSAALYIDVLLAHWDAEVCTGGCFAIDGVVVSEASGVYAWINEPFEGSRRPRNLIFVHGVQFDIAKNPRDWLAHVAVGDPVTAHSLECGFMQLRVSKMEVVSVRDEYTHIWKPLNTGSYAAALVSCYPYEQALLGRASKYMVLWLE